MAFDFYRDADGGPKRLIVPTGYETPKLTRVTRWKFWCTVAELLPLRLEALLEDGHSEYESVLPETNYVAESQSMIAA